MGREFASPPRRKHAPPSVGEEQRHVAVSPVPGSVSARVTKAASGAAPAAAPASAGSARSSLFGLFRRGRSGSSTTATLGTSTTSLRSTGGESVFGVFDNMSADPAAAGAGVATPKQAREAGTRVARMLDAAEQYRLAIGAMSQAAVAFGETLYECADTRGAEDAPTALPDHSVSSDLQAAGGLHLLISNHANILAASLESQVLEPGRRAHAGYTARMREREDEFRTALRARMQLLRQAEAQRAKESRHSTSSRHLAAYRSSLLDLTSQIDDINRVKFEFLSDLHALGVDLAESLHSSLASAVTAEIEVFEGIARKGWSGGGLDGLLAGCPDPFEPRRDRDFTSSGSSGAGAGAGAAAGASSASATHATSLNGAIPRTPSDAALSATLDLDSDDESSAPASAKSPNLFSIIPPGPILPQDRDDSSVEGMADLTLTPDRRPASSHEDLDLEGDKIDLDGGNDVNDDTGKENGIQNGNENGNENGDNDIKNDAENGENGIKNGETIDKDGHGSDHGGPDVGLGRDSRQD